MNTEQFSVDEQHGSLYVFFRDDAFNGENALTGITLPMDQQQFGLSHDGESGQYREPTGHRHRHRRP
jgi:hypothetical protein